MPFPAKSPKVCPIVHDVRMTDMDQKQLQKQIQRNLSLKNITWKESGIPTLTQAIMQHAGTTTSPSKKKKADTSSEFSDDFILDFDSAPLNSNGHKLDCSCKNCIRTPRSQEVTVLSSMKADPVKNPLNKKRH